MSELSPVQTPPTLQEPLFCTRCHAQIRETDNYCHACGKSLKPGRGFLFTHAGIILMALVLGPLALPFVWFSKVLSPAAKFIYTAVLLLLGTYMVYALWQAVNLINSSFQTLGSF